MQHALRVLALQQELRTLRRHHTEHTLPLCVAVSEVCSAGDHLQWGLLAGLVLGVGGGREFLLKFGGRGIFIEHSVLCIHKDSLTIHVCVCTA